MMCARTGQVKFMEEILRELGRTGLSSVNLFTYALGRKRSSKAYGLYARTIEENFKRTVSKETVTQHLREKVSSTSAKSNLFISSLQQRPSH